MKKHIVFNRSSRILSFILLSLALSLFYLCNTAEATDYFVKDDGTGSTCTQGTPCPLQTAIGMAGDGDTIYVAGGTYIGSGETVVELTNSVNLLGGWNGLTGSIVRDPDTYISTLDGGGTRRVIHISGSGETPTIDGFTITNGNATGLTTDCLGTDTNTPDGCGGGIFIYQADPVISNNIISNNYAATASPSGGYVGYGGGMYLRSSSNAQITKNKFNSNTGSSITYGRGGAIYSTACGSGVSIQDNSFTSNYACTGSGYGYGAVLYLVSGDILIQGNRMENNQSSLSWYNGTCVTIWDCSPTIRNNSILNNLGDGSVDAAVRLGYFGGTFEGNRVINNSMHSAVRLEYDSDSDPTITNNIIEGIETYTIFVNSTSGETLATTLKHNTIIGKGAEYGVSIGGYSNVTMWNNIVANHTTTGVTVSPTSTLLQGVTLFWGNTSDGVRGSSPVDGDPAFKNPSASNYLIKGSSAAIDAGANVALMPDTDIDGDARPKGSGYDIGADEFYSNTLSGIIMMLLN